MTDRTLEHWVVLPGGGQAIRARTVKRKPADARWDDKAIKEIRATPRVLHPIDVKDKEAKNKEEKFRVEIQGE